MVHMAKLNSEYRYTPNNTLWADSIPTQKEKQEKGDEQDWIDIEKKNGENNGS